MKNIWIHCAGSEGTHLWTRRLMPEQLLELNFAMHSFARLFFLHFFFVILSPPPQSMHTLFNLG